MKLPNGSRVKTPYGQVGTVVGRSPYGTAVVRYDSAHDHISGVEWPDDRLTVLELAPACPVYGQYGHRFEGRGGKPGSCACGRKVKP